MQDFLEFTPNSDGSSQVASPMKGYTFGSIRGSVVEYDVGSASVVQKESEVIYDVLSVSGALSASRTFQMYLDTTSKKGVKLYKVVLNLSAKSGGPFTLTFSTGISGKQNVVVTTATATDTSVAPKIYQMDLFVDSLGNVSSSGSVVSGVAADGHRYLLLNTGDDIPIPAPLPTAVAGRLGEWKPLASAIGAAFVLPAKGTWAYFAYRFENSAYGYRWDGVNIIASVAAGGSTVGAAAAYYKWAGFVYQELK